MLKAVIFDFDGVIADSEPLHCRAFVEVLSRYGVRFTEQQYYADYLGYTDADCVEALVKDPAMGLDRNAVGDVLSDKTRLFEQIARQDSAIIDGVADFISMLKANDIPLAICSGALGSDIDLMLEGTELKECFGVIVTADDVKRGKPDPEGFVLTLKRLNEAGPDTIHPNQCVVVEDSFWGLDAAGAAGMKRLAVTNTYPADKLAPYADMVVKTIGGLTIDEMRAIC